MYMISLLKWVKGRKQNEIHETNLAEVPAGV